jgi:tetratricopeptide (TPR) repeat protein
MSDTTVRPADDSPLDLSVLARRCGELSPGRLVEALREDQARRWRGGRPLWAEAYLDAFPDLAGDPDDALVLIWGEVLLRSEVGESPRLEEYRARFPQHADALALQFELQRHLVPTPPVGAWFPDHAPTEQPGYDPAGREPGLPQVSGFEILGELGRGGMGVVYKARQLRLNRLVALKMVWGDGQADPQRMLRFLQEAELAARLQHPNIVAVHEVLTDAGRVCLALEYVDGSTLAKQYGGTAQPPAEAARLVEVLAAAAHEAHQRGIIHRDLKPGNVLLTRGGVPKIADFGLAKRAGADCGLTQTGDILGTPSYLAPEQAEGKPGAVGPAADVYALGAILYELLTGRPPFRGESPMETVRRVLHEEPPRVRRLRPAVPRDLETICLKCLRKEPAQRYASAAALAEDLRRFQAGESVLARPVGAAERTWRWARRRPAVAGLLAALAVVLVASMAGLTGLWLRADRLRHEAEDNLRDARENFQLCLDAVDQLGTDISEDPRLQEHDLRALRRQLLRKAAQFHEVFVSKRRDDPEIQAQQARASFLLGQLTAQIDSKQRAIDYFLQARDILEGLRQDRPDVPDHPYQLSRCLRQLGALYADTGKKSQAQAVLDEAQNLAENLAAGHADVPDYQQERAATQTALGRFHEKFGKAAEAQAPLLRAIEILDALTREHPDVAAYRQDLARGQALLGSLYDLHMMELRRWRDAKPAYEKALAAQAELTRQYPKVPDYRADQARYLYLLARWYRKANQPREAEATYRQALDVQEPLAREHRSVTPYAQLLGGIYYELGILYANAQNWPKANDALQNALTVREALAARDPSDVTLEINVSNAQSRMGEAALNLGDPSGALEWFSRAIASCTKAKERSPDDWLGGDALVLAHTLRAEALGRLGRHAEALEDWDHVLGLPAGHGQPWNRLQRGLTLARLGEHERAAREAEEVLVGRYSDVVVQRLSRDAADVYAVAATAALQDAKRPDAERTVLADRYAAAAVASLRRAVQKGYKDGSKIDQDKDLESLRSREDFKSLLEELGRKSGTDGP